MSKAIIPAPCICCTGYDTCQCIFYEEAEELINSYYMYNASILNTLLDYIEDSLFFNTIRRLQKICPKLTTYFPFKLMYPNDHANRQLKCPETVRIIFGEEEWAWREVELIHIYDCDKAIKRYVSKEEIDDYYDSWGKRELI